MVSVCEATHLGFLCVDSLVQIWITSATTAVGWIGWSIAAVATIAAVFTAAAVSTVATVSTASTGWILSTERQMWLVWQLQWFPWFTQWFLLVVRWTISTTVFDVGCFDSGQICNVPAFGCFCACVFGGWCGQGVCVCGDSCCVQGWIGWCVVSWFLLLHAVLLHNALLP